ncbi:DinB family protein [bacterium]|nr:DinB family protein [bacterium]
MNYSFLIETYATERLKTLSLWSLFREEDMPLRPHRIDQRGRSVCEQMVHQCVSEDFWFRTMLQIDVGAPPLPAQEARLNFLQRYSEDSQKRLQLLESKEVSWFEEETKFFDVIRSRSWILARRLVHSAHHRGQLAAMLRMLNRDLYSTYGPTADTGGLMQNSAPTIYAYPNEESLLEGEKAGGKKNPLPVPGSKPCTERPDSK